MSLSLSPSIAATLDHVDQSLDSALQRLLALLRIPSISTQPAHAADCRRAAEWLAADLASIGFAASVRESNGHPMVVAHDHTATDGPHVLFYGHYDVQPVDPLELWTSPPFVPAVVETAASKPVITGRGASDDKGQVMTFIEALRALKQTHDGLPVRVSILIEGEEECGGPSLLPFMVANRDELAADFALICDTTMLGPIPAITTALRGLVGEEITLRCATRDLHSGLYGNAARNPLQVLVDILASLRNADGSVNLPGFYDNVAPPSAETRAAWTEIGPDILAPVGLSLPAGEAGYTAIEQTWARPSYEINGITGGYSGKGFKTVLPGEASAKISFRMVAGQDPIAIRDAFRAHVRARLPEDCHVTFEDHGASRASAVPADSIPVAKAIKALTEEWGRQAVTIGSGGSIPVVHDFQQALGMDSLLVGFAQADNCVHAPNEKYDLVSFHKGTRSWVRILCALGGVE